jgi:aspartate/methionine/tyrosine aminotransferase
MTKLPIAHRLQTVKSNVFADMDRAKATARSQGKTIFDLSLGSSDLPVSEEIIAVIKKSLDDPTTHGYLLHRGTQEFRNAVALWYRDRFGIPIDPETEVLPLIGSQEGTGHLPLAILNPGDYALLLDPGYPSHAGGVYLAGGQIYPMPIREENQFLPIFEDIPEFVLAQARMMVLSYPNNPTTAIAPIAFFKQAVAFCQQHNIVLVHDFPYLDLYFEGSEPPPSILQADPQKSVSIEFFTFSKSHNMGGFRIGFAIGNVQLISGLRQVKAMIDFNQYLGILNGAIAALQASPDAIQKTVHTFQQRRDTFVKALHRQGWLVPTPPATMYIWAKLPEPWANHSLEFCLQLVAATGIAVAPGAGFGQAGEGYVRFALVHEPKILEELADKIVCFMESHQP